MEYLDYYITDIKLHAQLPTNPKSMDRAIKKSANSGKIQRTYRRIKKQDYNSNTKSLKIDLSLENELRRAQEYAVLQGKSLRVFIPKTGIKVLIAPDGIEKMRAIDKMSV